MVVSPEPQPRILAPSMGSSATGRPDALSLVRRPLPWMLACLQGCRALWGGNSGSSKGPTNSLLPVQNLSWPLRRRMSRLRMAHRPSPRYRKSP